MRRDPTAFVRDHYDTIAHRYDRVIRFPERVLFADGRQWATAQAGGDVLEVAVGTGRNLPYYRADASVTGIDLSLQMLGVARRRARESAAPIQLHVADAHRLPFRDATFDTVVATLALCSIPDDVRAVTEAARVLRPGGALVLLEHVRSPSPVVRTVQRLLEPLLLRLEGDHLLRQPDRSVTQAGLHIEQLERSKLGIVLRLKARRSGGHADLGAGAAATTSDERDLL